MQAAPLYEDVADGPPDGAAWWCMAADGVRLRIAAWPAAPDSTVEGTVLLFPGRTEYIEKYGHVARHLTSAGFAVATLDWRGQGLSARSAPDPRLGHIADFSEFQQDIAALLDLARRRDLPGPFFLLGHSMGGCIGLRALHEGLPVRAAAFSAPMWGIRLERWEWPMALVAAFAGPLVGLGGRLAPSRGLEHQLVTGPFEENDLTTDRAMWDRMKVQIDRYPDLALGGPTLSWGRAALLETVRLARMPSPDIPALAFVGDQERVVSPRAIADRMARWPAGRLEVVDGAEHEVMMERERIRRRFLDAATLLFLEHG